MMDYEIAVRLFLSLVCGGLIGIERESQNKAGGLRTHILVAVGSTLIMMVSQYGIHGTDPSRIAAQVVSGIGFLGTGTILREKDGISGLTTAASLWVTAGIGLAIGTGFNFGALVAMVIVLFSLVPLGFFTSRISTKGIELVVKCENRVGLIGDISKLYNDFDINIHDINFRHHRTDENHWVTVMILSEDLDRKTLVHLIGSIRSVHGVHELVNYP